jgi:hypothetical protein
MNVTRGRRRSAAVAVGVVLATLTMMLGTSPAQAQEPPPGLIPEGDWSQAQIDWLLGWIDRTETTLPEHFPTSFNDGGAQLRALGFYNFGATAPGGYDHWINPAWVVDAHFLNPQYAESLVYQRASNGRWVLKAAMYQMPPDMEMAEIPPLIHWLPGWHGHPELCVTDRGTFGGVTDPDNPNCPPGTHQGTTPVMVHVWLEDPGCGHRFGGVGVSGLHCDTDHHGDG